MVLELKLQASPNDARADFRKLDSIIETLNYDSGVFINIASDATHAKEYGGRFKARLHFLAVRLTADGTVKLSHERFAGENLVQD